MNGPKDSVYLEECRRLTAEQSRAVQADDAEAYQAATDALSHFLRMAGMGRMDEYFASRRLTGEEA